MPGDGTDGGIQGPRRSCPCRQNNPGDFLTCLVPGDVEEGRREPSLSWLAWSAGGLGLKNFELAGSWFDDETRSQASTHARSLET